MHAPARRRERVELPVNELDPSPDDHRAPRHPRGIDTVADIVVGAGGQLADPMALALALIASVAPRRYAPAVFALWITIRLLVTTLATLGSDVPAAWVIAVGTIGCVISAAALLVRGRATDAARFQAPAAAA
jgi:hypothetical protein